MLQGLNVSIADSSGRSNGHLRAGLPWPSVSVAVQAMAIRPHWRSQLETVACYAVLILSGSEKTLATRPAKVGTYLATQVGRTGG